MKRRASVALSLGALLALPVAAAAGPPGNWTKVSDPATSTLEPGLARTSDGVLHVAWHKKVSSEEEQLWQTGIRPNGSVAGRTPIVTGWTLINPAAVLLAPPGGLRAVFAGLPSSSPEAIFDPRFGSLSTSLGTPAGTGWSEPEVTNGTDAPGEELSEARSLSAALGISGTQTADGTPITTWGDGAPGTSSYHVGSDRIDPDLDLPGDLLLYPNVAVDRGSGQIVVAWRSNDPGNLGLFAQGANPTALIGAPTFIDGSATPNRSDAVNPFNRVPIAARIGGGVYLAYGTGYPSFTAVRLKRFGSSGSILVRKAAVRSVGVAADPQGRLWVFWEESRGLRQTYYATRTNPAATRLGALVRVSRPPTPAGGSTYSLSGDAGSDSGLLDLISHAATGLASDGLTWHTQVRPGLTLTASRAGFPNARGGLVGFRVLDAGVPVKGARVRVAGTTVTTNAAGRASILFVTDGPRDPGEVVLGARARRYLAVAGAAGYVPASGTISAR